MNAIKYKGFYFLILGVVFLWCTMIWLPPFISAQSQSFKTVDGNFKRFFSHICHQLDSRSLHIGGHQLLVCTRCMAIYFGFFVGLLIFPFVHRVESDKIRLLFIFSVLFITFDAVMGVLPFYKSSIYSRLITGGIFGVISAFLLYPLLEDAFYNHIKPSKQLYGEIYECKT